VGKATSEGNIERDLPGDEEKKSAVVATGRFPRDVERRERHFHKGGKTD